MTTPFQFTLSRTFDAPLAKVWEAWTDAEKLQRWFGPKDVKIFHSELDLRPKGFYHYGLENADGSRYWGRWIFTEIAPMTRLVFIVSFSNDKMEVTRHPMAPDWPLEFHSTILFAPKGDKTDVEVRWRAHNANATEAAAFEAGDESMRIGWTGTFDVLEDYLKTA